MGDRLDGRLAVVVRRLKDRALLAVDQQDLEVAFRAAPQDQLVLSRQRDSAWGRLLSVHGSGRDSSNGKRGWAH